MHGWFGKYYGAINGNIVSNQKSDWVINPDSLQLQKVSNEYNVHYDQNRQRSLHMVQAIGGYSIFLRLRHLQEYDTFLIPTKKL